jgi:phage antirepressor YoqD-like protein
LVLTSRKAEAKIFKKWVTSEVLPSIRKTGSYQPAQTEETMLLALFPKTDKNLITLTAHTIRDNKQKEALLLEQKPKVEFYEQVTSSKDAVDIGTVAKVLNIKNIGRAKLFEFLRTNKILDSKNMPYQKHIDSGWFRLIESSWQDKHGSNHIYFKTVVYQKGIDAIRKLILRLQTSNTEFHQDNQELLAS